MGRVAAGKQKRKKKLDGICQQQKRKFFKNFNSLLLPLENEGMKKRKSGLIEKLKKGPPVKTSSCLKLSSTFQREDSLASGQIPETWFCSFSAARGFCRPWDPQRLVFSCFFFLNQWQEKIFHLHRPFPMGLPSLKVSAPPDSLSTGSHVLCGGFEKVAAWQCSGRLYSFYSSCRCSVRNTCNRPPTAAQVDHHQGLLLGWASGSWGRDSSSQQQLLSGSPRRSCDLANYATLTLLCTASLGWTQIDNTSQQYLSCLQ